MWAHRRIAVALLVSVAAALGAAVADHGPARSRPYPDALPRGPGQEIGSRSCLMCHSAMLITQQSKDSTGWAKTVSQMEKWGVVLTPAERDTLVGYLALELGRGRKP